MLGTGVIIITMDTSIFEAFPNAIISGVWEIGTCQHGTLVGNQYNKIGNAFICSLGNSYPIY